MIVDGQKRENCMTYDCWVYDLKNVWHMIPPPSSFSVLLLMATFFWASFPMFVSILALFSISFSSLVAISSSSFAFELSISALSFPLLLSISAWFSPILAVLFLMFTWFWLSFSILVSILALFSSNLTLLLWISLSSLALVFLHFPQFSPCCFWFWFHLHQTYFSGPLVCFSMHW